MKRGKPVTIKEIAKKLRVSPSTVSRALKDHPSIGLVTTMRVKKMAKELNYEPNQRAIFFKQKKTFTIGVIVPSLLEPFFSEAITAIEEAANEKSYTVLMGQSKDDANRELKIIDTFRKHRVDGVLISLGKHTYDTTFIEELKEYDIPLVFFDCVPNVEGIPKIYCKLETGIREAVKAFLNRGHQHIALINGPETLSVSKEREVAFIRTLKEEGFDFNNQYVVYSDLSEKGNQEAMETLISMPTRPSAVISFNDYVTLDVMKYAREKGVVINQDIHFISFANYHFWNYIENPPMGSIEQYPGQQGRKATEILFELIDKEEKRGDRNVSIDSKLILH
ncbi:MAG TPA: LacI family DNA-binding transcriptional regulator [Sphingobacterium sp.]|nr:LacI family DNA-binding transcriptional regulator [Sphingobacterium sp.]